MPAPRLSDAERMRRHREELQLALAEDLPLAEARRILADRRAEARRRAWFEVKSPAPASTTLPPAAPAPRFWWQRD
jgi:hypothetical protein